MKAKILIFLCGVLLLIPIINSCKKMPTLGNIPISSFKVENLTPTDDNTNSYNIMLVNTSAPRGIAYWTISGLGNYKGDTVKLAIPLPSTYDVVLVVLGAGGISDTAKGTVTTTETNRFAMGPASTLGFLTNASTSGSKIWYANPAIGAMAVAPNLPEVIKKAQTGNGDWWSTGVSDIIARAGYFDDSYTFVFADNSFVYDDKGTFYSDGTYMTTPKDVNLISPTDYLSAQKTWASGTFTYSIVSAPAGAMKLGQITIYGKGAHFGLAGKENGGELGEPTAISITYDILDRQMNLTDEATGKTYDLMIIGLSYNSSGNWWAFVMRSDH